MMKVGLYSYLLNLSTLIPEDNLIITSAAACTNHNYNDKLRREPTTSDIDLKSYPIDHMLPVGM